LPCLVPRKGEVLMALTHFWLTQVMPEVPNHLLAWGREFHRWQNAGWYPSRTLGLPLERTVLVEELDVWSYEMVFRHHLGGSVWSSYQQDGTVAGIELPKGLSKWQKLGEPIFTPTSKEESGHDRPMTVAEYYTKTGDLDGQIALTGREIYTEAYRYAFDRGLAILDTKFEFGIEKPGTAELIILCDEVLTPDSSRYTTIGDLEMALIEGRDPIFYDKEPVRVWGRGIETPWSQDLGLGLQKLDPENKEHLAFVADLEIPEQIIGGCAVRYLNLFEMLTGRTLDDYQIEVMNIPRAS